MLDSYEHIGRGDPPFFTVDPKPDLDETMISNQGEVIHHLRAHVALYERCEAAGLDCAIDTQDLSTFSGSIEDWLILQLTVR